MGVTQGAGLSLQWFRNQLAPGVGLRRADGGGRASSPAGAQGLFWLPYLMGERTPHLDADGARRLDRADGEAHARRPDPRGDRRRVATASAIAWTSSRSWAWR